MSSFTKTLPKAILGQFLRSDIMSLINISDLTFSYEGSYQNVFESVSFQMDTDWKLGCIGRNGRGKTTLLNLLCGRYEYSGSITASVNFEYFPFEWKGSDKMTIEGVDYINPVYELWALQKELSLLKVDEEVLYRPFKTLSGGEQTKVMLAVLFTKENNFLLIDEPTNHLDAEAREIVSKYLKGKKGFILVSHDRDFLDRCVDHIIAINKTVIQVEKGNFSSWKENKDRTDHFEIERNINLKKEIKRLESTAKKTAQRADEIESKKIGKKAPPRTDAFANTRSYVAEKSRKLQQRRKNMESRRQNAIEEKSSLLKNIEEAEPLKLSMLSYHNQRLIELSQVSICYGEKIACENVSFNINSGDRIALCGKNGSGKSSILKLIAGEKLQYSGEFQKGKNIQISYVPQDVSFLSGNLKDFARSHKLDESLLKTLLHKLGFEKSQFEKDIKHFSAGQKKKVLLAKSLSERSHILLWDEPMNYIDVFSRIQIEDLLLEFQPTILFVEHDQTFLTEVASRRIDL